MTYPNIKPCPQCGDDEPLLFGYEGWDGSISSWRVECDACGYIGSCEGRKLDAIREHNRRAALAKADTSEAAQAASQGPGIIPKETP